MKAVGGAGVGMEDEEKPSYPSDNLMASQTTSDKAMFYRNPYDVKFSLPTIFPKKYERSIEVTTIPDPYNSTKSVSIEKHHFFRDATKVLPLLESNKDFVVYYISAHGTLLAEPFLPHVIGDTTVEPDGIPYCVIQTGAKESTGCEFRVGGNPLLQNLFSVNLPYSFQYLLGLQGDSPINLFQDLHYTTNDYEVDDRGMKYVESIPNKNFSFSEKNAEKFDYGVYMYDPNSFKLGSPYFVRLDKLDYYLTRGTESIGMSASNSPRGITLQELLPLIVKTTGLTKRPSIFVFYSCAYLTKTDNSHLESIMGLMGKETKYHNKPNLNEFPFIKPYGSLPAIATTHVLSNPINYRGSNPGYPIRTFYEKGTAAANKGWVRSPKTQALIYSMEAQRKPASIVKFVKENPYSSLVKYVKKNPIAAAVGSNAAERLLKEGVKIRGGTRKQRRHCRKTVRASRNLLNL